jgi:hypothetical protein
VVAITNADCGSVLAEDYDWSFGKESVALTTADTHQKDLKEARNHLLNFEADIDSIQVITDQ